MAQFTLPLSARDRGRIELREHLARAARNMHFVAMSRDAVNGAKLLMVSATLADLAMSIPMGPAPWTTGGLVDGPTLFAAHLLQSDAADAGNSEHPGR
jgi:hypothetical protein